MIRLTLALIVACLLAGTVAAKDAKVGEASLQLPAPDGYCDLDFAQRADLRMIDAIDGMLAKSGNRLLSVSADCAELSAWRAGRQPLLDHMTQHQTLSSLENSPLPTTPDLLVSESCNVMRTQGEQLVAGMTPDIKTRAEEVLKSVKINDMKFMGVIAEDPLVCYSAILQKFRTEVGTDKTQVALFATTVIRDKIIYYYLFAPYIDGSTVTQMLELQRTNVAKLRAANP